MVRLALGLKAPAAGELPANFSLNIVSERFTSCETLPHPPRIASLPSFAPCFSDGGKLTCVGRLGCQLPKFRTCGPISVARSMIHDNSIVLTPLTPRDD